MTLATKFRLSGPLVLFCFGLVFFRLNVYLTGSPSQLIRVTGVAIGCGYLGWEIGRRAVLALQRWYPGLAQTRQRQFTMLLLILALANLNGSLRVVINALLRIGLYQVTVSEYVATVGIQIVYACVYVGIYEGWYLIRQWRQTYVEKEQLLKAEWQARFDSLKSQVNPHFLFNSLNALSSLIDESPVQAGRFVDELANVYRYLLQANDCELTTVRAELTFIQSYAHLLKTRYGDGIAVQLTVPESVHAHQLPPLSLQLLVENAVKHNVISPHRPLRIEISVYRAGPGQTVYLLVWNNRQRKPGPVLSNGVGLTNIAAKYRMVTQADITIEAGETSFIVGLPLLSSQPVPA